MEAIGTYHRKDTLLTEMKIKARAFSKELDVISDTIFCEEVISLLGVSIFKILFLGPYWKLKGRIECTLEFEYNSKEASVFLGSLGSCPVLKTSIEVIYDTEQGSSIKSNGVGWLHLEIMD
jgi:hypothetical protein